MNLTKKDLSTILKKELGLSFDISDSLVDEFFYLLDQLLGLKKILSCLDLVLLKHLEQKKEWVEIQRAWKILRFHPKIKFVLAQPQKPSIS